MILLHGAAGAGSHFSRLAALLSDHGTVHTLNFSGHGGAPMGDAPFSIAGFAGEVLHYMDENDLAVADIFGYSMGGYVAMYLARYQPARTGRVVTLGTKFTWDPSIAAREVQMLNPDKIEQKVPAFAASLRQLHAPGDWKLLLQCTADMLTDMGANNPLKPADFARIAVPVLLMLGDRDKMVTTEETGIVYRALPQAQLAILPGTAHPIEQVDPGLLAFMIRRFLS